MQWAEVARTAPISIVGNAVKVDGLATFEDADVAARVREIVAAAFTPDDSPQSPAEPHQPPAPESTAASSAAVVDSTNRTAPAADDDPDPWPAEPAPQEVKAKPTAKAKPVVKPEASTAAVGEDLF
jgi:hypothetical protein